MRSKLKLTVSYLVVAAVAWEPLASYGLSKVLTLNGDIPWSILPFAEAYYWWNWSSIPAVAYWTKVCGLGAAALLLAPLALALLQDRKPRLDRAKPGQAAPPPTRAASDVHGHADWLPIAEARKLFSGPHPAYGGVVIGEAYRVDQDRDVPLRSTGPGQMPFAAERSRSETWGRGGRMPLLVEPCREGSTHGTIFAGSGGFKTTAMTIPTMLSWTGSALVFDPPGQVRPVVEAARRAMGHEIRVIGPCKGGVNALAWIDPADPRAETHIQEVLNWIGGDVAEKATGENAMFVQMGRDLLTAILADLIFDPAIPKREKTLKAFREKLNLPQDALIAELNAIRDNSPSRLSRALAQTCRPKAMETFAGVVANAMSETNFLATEVFADMVSSDDFDIDEIRSGKTTVFAEITKADLKSAPALGRIVVALFQNALRRAEGRGLNGKRVLFWLEESRELGRLDILADMMAADRKYGATIVTFWQSEGDLASIWEDQAGIFEANSSWLSYAAITEEDTCKKISAMCGTYTVLTHTEGQSDSTQSGINSGSRNKGNNASWAEGARPLIRPEEVRSMRADEQIVFRRGVEPMAVSLGVV